MISRRVGFYFLDGLQIRSNFKIKKNKTYVSRGTKTSKTALNRAYKG